MRRPPAVAGQFYYGSPAQLKGQVEQYVSSDAVKETVIGAISPHAGLIYSGHVAGAVYSSISFPETFILLGPNHTGLGARLSLMTSGEWEIPTGVLTVDDVLAGAIAAEVPLLSSDTGAHQFEHSLEVQLPFIAYYSVSAKIIPIAVMNASLEECRQVGEGIARAVKHSGRRVVVVASSDMSHYISDTSARELDKLALSEVLSMDPEGLYSTVLRKNISMCGFIPATIMLYAAKSLGAHEARLVKYATSGEVSGDYEHVVGYAGVVVK
ncbi:MAG: AmmeMemoRadiSam system protein B [Nitrospirae bacterium]|nr:AmmeMemoRadiSam system protein B [Nitrospirota bacterium]